MGIVSESGDRGKGFARASDTDTSEDQGRPEGQGRQSGPPESRRRHAGVDPEIWLLRRGSRQDVFAPPVYRGLLRNWHAGKRSPTGTVDSICGWKAMGIDLEGGQITSALRPC